MTWLVRCGLLLTLLGFSACSGLPQIAPEPSLADLRGGGKGVLVVAARFVSTTQSTTCDNLELTRAGDGRKQQVILALRYPFVDPEIHGAVTLDPGTYAVTKAYCARPGVNFIVEPADPRGMARISIGAGEVVDGGMLVVIEDFNALVPLLGVGKSKYAAIVRPRVDPLPASLKGDLAAKLVHRPMTELDAPPYEVLAGICAHHREQAPTSWYYDGKSDSPLCRLIGPPPGRTAPPRRPAGQPA